jgi:1,2-phenylacetyl-CoA epoxidase PaaB subunit
MPDYRVRFCNDLDDSTGHHFHPCQREVEVRGAADRDIAIETARREFERREGVADWRLRAKSIECEEMA